MPRIQPSTINDDTVTVHVDANELQCDVRLLPYPTCIGTISRSTGKVRLWTPAASTPRGYKAAALRMLEEQAKAFGLDVEFTIEKTPGMPFVYQVLRNGAFVTHIHEPEGIHHARRELAKAVARANVSPWTRECRFAGTLGERNLWTSDVLAALRALGYVT